jgi:hypothetical protein
MAIDSTCSQTIFFVKDTLLTAVLTRNVCDSEDGRGKVFIGCQTVRGFANVEIPHTVDLVSLPILTVRYAFEGVVVFADGFEKDLAVALNGVATERVVPTQKPILHPLRLKVCP